MIPFDGTFSGTFNKSIQWFIHVFWVVFLCILSCYARSITVVDKTFCIHDYKLSYNILDDTSLERQDDDQTRSDPVKFCSHIPGHIKQTKHRIAQQKIEATMTPEERSQEREIQRRQLEEIFRVMEEQKDKFGVNDFTDVQEQMKMYIQWICLLVLNLFSAFCSNLYILFLVLLLLGS